MPSVSLGCFHPTLHVPLCVRVDIAGCLVGILGTIVPAPGDKRPEVMDWRLHLFFVIHSGRTGAGSFWGAGSCCCAGSCSGYGFLSADGSVPPSTAALSGAVFLEENDELRVNRRELSHESRNSGHELCDGGLVTCCGRRYVRDGFHRFLLEAPVVRVCGGAVRGDVGGLRLVMNREAPLPVGGGKNTFRRGIVLSTSERFFHSQQSAAKTPMLKRSWYALSTTCLLE